MRQVPWLTFVLAGAAIAIFAFSGVGELLQYDRLAIAAGQIWRPLTGHLAHWSLDHLFWDAAVFALLGGLCERRDLARFLVCVVGSAALISASVWLAIPDMTYYRGLSGVDSALFAMLVVLLAKQAIEQVNGRLLAVTLLASGAFLVKLAIELRTGQAVFIDSAAAGIVPVPLAHAGGATWGAMVAATAMLPRVRATQLHGFISHEGGCHA